METHNLDNKGLIFIPSQLRVDQQLLGSLAGRSVRCSNVPLLGEGVGERVPSSRGPWCHCGM